MTDGQGLTCTLSAFSGLSAELLHSGKSLKFQAHGFSMRPLLRDGDLLLVEPAKSRKIRVGDVVLFSKPSGSVVLHRVLQIKTGLDGYSFLIQGDQIPTPDGWIPQDRVHGRIVKVERSDQQFDLNKPIIRILGLLAVLRSRFGFGRKGLPFHLERAVKRLPLFYRYLI